MANDDDDRKGWNILTFEGCWKNRISAGGCRNFPGQLTKLFIPECPILTSYYTIFIIFCLVRIVNCVKSSKIRITSLSLDELPMYYVIRPWWAPYTFQMRFRISIRGCVRPFVGRSVRPSIGRSHSSWISKKWAKFEQNSIRKKKVCHLKDNSKTSTRAVRQRTQLSSELCSTCFL